MKKLKFELLSLVAIVLGIILGVFVPEGASYFEFMGTIFLSLIKVISIPIIILSLFLAIARISSVNDLKEIGFKTIGYYFTTTAIAVITGLTLANFFIFQVNLEAIDFFDSRDNETYKEKVINVGVTDAVEKVDFAKRIFSDNIFNSLANGDILHIVVFTILFSLAFIFLDERKKSTLIDISDSLYESIFKLIEWVLKIAPLGILSLVWFAVSTFESKNIEHIKSFFIATILAAIIHSIISLPLIGKFLGKFNVFDYFQKVKGAIIIAITTASSLATLPVSTKLVEENGVSKKVSRFVLPIGASLNMDGSALYQALLAMLFIAMSGIEISGIEQILVFIFIVLSSAGTAGIPSGGLIMMAMVLELLEIPNDVKQHETYLALYLMIDRFWDYPITSINVWGDLIGAKTVDSLIKR